MESNISAFNLVLQIVIAFIINTIKSARGAEGLNKGTKVIFAMFSLLKNERLLITYYLLLLIRDKIALNCSSSLLS